MSEKREEVKTVVSKTGLQSWWDNFADFIKEAFIKTPFETIFELALLTAGGSRTIDFMKKMGQSGFIAGLALIYAEVGLIFMEFLSYRGKRVQYTYKDRKGNEYKAYPFINQKSLAKFGLWFIHIPMTVFFTASDIIKSNLEMLAKENSVGFGNLDFDTGFAWALGFVVAIAFFADLVIIINYKATDPEKKHKEEMNQLEHDRLQHYLEMERLREEEILNYERNNKESLIRAEVKLKKRKEYLEQYKESLGEDYLESVLEEVDLSVKNKNKPIQNNVFDSAKPKRKYEQTGRYAKQKQEPKTISQEKEIEHSEDGVESNFPVEGEKKKIDWENQKFS
jgi:hypothetical protein